MHDRILKTIKTAEESPSDTALKKKKQRALIQLRYDNRNSYLRKELAHKQIKIDELNRSLSRKAAVPTANLQALQPILDQIASLRAEITKLSSEVHFEVLHHVPNMIDDARSALSTGTFDEAVLFWDRRPFEPLHIEPEELYPRDTDMTMIYFEADADSPITRLTNQVDEASRANLYRIYEAVSLIFGSRGAMPVSELLNSLFPSRPINDLVRAIPSLATHATRTPKPNFDDLPKTVHGRPGEGPGKLLDPVSNFQENLDYDLSDVRIRCLSPITLWEIILEYQKDNNTEVNMVQLNRLLGGTLTSFRAGEYSVEPKKLR
jgi:transcription factor 1